MLREGVGRLPDRSYVQAGCEPVVGHYWSSMFNTDLSEMYFETANNEPRVKNLQTWVASSAEDSMFVLNANWRKAGRLRDILAAKMRSDGPLVLAQQKLSATVQGCVQELEAAVNRILDDVRGSVRYEESLVSSAFQDSLQTSVYEACKTTIDELKCKTEKVVRQANEDRQAYLRLVNKGKAIKDQTVLHPWPGGNW